MHNVLFIESLTALSDPSYHSIFFLFYVIHAYYHNE